jgi:hypothetical protein
VSDIGEDDQFAPAGADAGLVEVAEVLDADVDGEQDDEDDAGDALEEPGPEGVGLLAAGHLPRPHLRSSEDRHAESLLEQVAHDPE